MIASLQELIWTVVSSNPLVERLAIASIDLVVVTALVAIIVAVARIRSRRVVALLWLVALIKPIVSLAVAAPVPLIPLHARATTPVPAVAVGTPAHAFEFVTTTTERDGTVLHDVEALTTVPPDTAPKARDRGSLGKAVAALWISGVLVMLGAGAVERLRLRRVLAASLPAGDEMEARVERIAHTMRRGTPPRVRVTEELESPALAGTLRPVVLLPAWIVESEHGERLEWALRHELAHWHSRDHVANVASEAARALFFFHPAAWWAARRWKEAMEMACDESVVADRRDVKRYAEQLYQILAHVDQRRRLALSSSLFATRTQIGRRIETLLRTQRTMARPGALAIALVCVFAAATFAVGPDVAPRPPRPPRAPHAAHEARAFAVSPAPPVAPGEAAPAVAGIHGHGNNKVVSYDNVNVNSNDDDYEMSLRAAGIEFEQNTGRVVSLREDGYLKVRETTGGSERRVIITPDEDGGLHAIYTVDGARSEWNDDAQAWLAGILRRHLTRVRNHNRNDNQLIMAPAVPRAFAVSPAPRAIRSVAPSPQPAPAPPSTETPAPPSSETPAPPSPPETEPDRK